MNKFRLFLLLLIVTSFFITACSSDSLTKGTKDGNNTTDSIKTETESMPEIDIAQKTKDFILKGQDNLPEADKIKWSESFLNQVNIEDVYKEYLSTGSKADDIQSFALYLTLNAPVPDNWENLVRTELLNTYDKEISRFEHLQDDLYQVYVEIDGSEVPFVVVNSRTGYFHG